MEGRYMILFTSAVVIALLTSPTEQQQSGGSANKCLEDFGTALLSCVTDNGLTKGNFLWFTTNGTSSKSEKPSDEAGYKTKICKLEEQIFGCTLQRVRPIIDSAACQGTSEATNQQGVVREQVTNIFGTYDQKCMHPCRNTLAKDLRECYTSSGLDPQLFLSNSSNGAVVGQDKMQVELFCGAKDTLITCMQDKADDCPEAPQILRAIRLDIPSFKKGVQVLCAHPQVYLHGLQCFNETTNQVDSCQAKETQKIVQLDTEATEGNWTEERFFKSFCQIAIEQIECDLAAWSNKNHEACVDAVIGLRRELECELVAPQCNVDPKQIDQLDHTCHPEKFKKKDRDNFGKGAASSIMSSLNLTLAGLTFLSFLSRRS